MTNSKLSPVSRSTCLVYWDLNLGRSGRDFRFWAQFIRKSVNYRITQFHFNPSKTYRELQNEEVAVTV